MDKESAGTIAFGEQRVSTGLLLAAGTGSRLAPLTDFTPKCLVKVNGVPMIDRLIYSLQSNGFRRLVIVLGHQASRIRDYLGNRAGEIKISYITSPLYETTNNIYSLWLVRKLIEEPFMLIESDLVFDAPLLDKLLKPDRIAVARLQPWMEGTTVTIDKHNQVQSFWCGDLEPHSATQYKTVNIYSLSRLAWHLVRKRLDKHIAAKLVNNYYETVFAELTSEGSLSFGPVFFESNRWHEIDTIEDLQTAEKMLIPYPPTDFGGVANRSLLRGNESYAFNER